MLTGDVRQKRMKLPAATARSAAFKGFEPAYTDFLQLNSKLNPSVGLFRPSLVLTRLPVSATPLK